MTDPTADAAKLLPCPFCGSPARYMYDRTASEKRNERHWAICDSCDAMEPTSVWNTRPQPAPPSQATVQVSASIPGQGGHDYSGPYPGSQPTPPEGEPDFAREADMLLPDDFPSSTDPNAPYTRGYRRQNLADEIAAELRKAYRLGLAARPKVEDAEVAALCAELRRPSGIGEPLDHTAMSQAADLLDRLSGERDEALTALRQLTILARTSGGVAGRDADLCAACDVAEAVLVTRTVDSVTHWMNGYAEMCQRAEAAETKLAEREAELAKADALRDAALLVVADWQKGFFAVQSYPCIENLDNLRNAARQQQKASAETTEREE